MIVVEGVLPGIPTAIPTKDRDSDWLRATTWNDFTRSIESLSDKKKGDLFEELVKAYLLLDPEYATKLRHVWLHREVPTSVRDALKLPAADKGIDLIAQTKEGEFWAVQCKYRTDTERSLPWREISTFTGLAFGVCRNISFGLVCTTTERITHVLKSQDRIGFCALDVWQNLDAEFFNRLRAALSQKPTPLKPLAPRLHQVAAIKDAHAHFVRKKERRGKLIMPCGTGKSLTAYWIAQKLDAKRILVAVPSLALIRQTLKVWLRESMANGQDVEWVCVCSDESAGRIERDDVSVLRQDLGIPCLTAPEEIAAWLGKTNHGLTVVFTTYQSGEAIAKAARRKKVSFDLGIMDEAHKTVGAKDKLFSHLLYDKNLPIRRRIFMTATERRYQGESDQILSMDASEIYGETFHLLTFKQALECKPTILSDYKIVTILVSRDEVKELVRKNVFVRPDKGRWDQEIEAEMLAALVALRKAMRKHPIHHAVSFHSSIRRAEVFRTHNEAYSALSQNSGKIATFHVSGQTPTGTRARLIKEFSEAKRGLITNARCLTEGVDVPNIDCVMFADPRRSAVDIVQAVGRALRPAPGKSMGFVIVPILHSAKAKPEDIFNTDSFKEVLSTLRALAANDDRIIEYFRAVSQGKHRSGGGSVEIDLDERLATRIDLAQFTRAIDLKCWDRLAKLSWPPFEDARAVARSLKLKNQDDWFAFTQGQITRLGNLPSDIPASPQYLYADKGWKGMGDWLGTGNVATFRREYRSFPEARSFVQKLKLKNASEWFTFTQGGRLPNDIPANPHQTYGDKGWKNFGDWLGTGRVANALKKYRSFSKARAYVQKLGLKSATEWRAFTRGHISRLGRLPKDIPVNPDQTYADNGWKGYGDWLGTGAIAHSRKEFRPFREARSFAQKLKLKSGAEWRAFTQGRIPRLRGLPKDIPANPDNTYSDRGWQGIGDWLGTGRIADRLKKYRSFRDARAFVQKLKLKNAAEWFAYSHGQIPRLGSLPEDIPATPRNTYAGKGWKSMGDWLGTGRIATHHREYRSFREARAFVHKLKLKSEAQWRAFTKSGKLPPDIPATPSQTYANKGWKNNGDWLGTGTIAWYLRAYRAFPKARAFARKLQLKSTNQWRVFTKSGRLPPDIPVNPDRTYADKGWQGYGDWLGTGRTRRSRATPASSAIAGS
jgi:superfamily II DNA or RNA helicase